jgi:hypothetical protein
MGGDAGPDFEDISATSAINRPTMVKQPDGLGNLIQAPASKQRDIPPQG